MFFSVASLYRQHLGDLSSELILFQPAIAASDSANVLLPATYVPFHTTAAFQPFNGIVVVEVFFFFFQSLLYTTVFLEVVRHVPKEFVSAFRDKSAQVRG